MFFYKRYERLAEKFAFKNTESRIRCNIKPKTLDCFYYLFIYLFIFKFDFYFFIYLFFYLFIYLFFGGGGSFFQKNTYLRN